jgi:xylulokinase
MSVLVGLDVGTTGIKAVATSPDGEVVARAEEEYPLSTPRPGWSEQDPELWWRAAETALARLGVRDVAGIGLSGQMHGLVVLGDRGQVLRPAILWNDQRTAPQCDEMEELVGRPRLIEMTGNRALAGFTAPKLLWLRAHEPGVYAAIAHVLLPKDYVRWRLTAERISDVTDASGTLLFDVANRRWSDELISALDLDHQWLPAVLESPAPGGTDPQGVPVAAGAGDQAAGALGVGVDRPGALSVVIGTSGVVFAALPDFLVDREARLHVFCHAVPGLWHAMGVTLSAAGALRWFRDAFGIRAGFASLLKEAESWDPGAEGATFLPYLAGERTPHADPDARASFSGLSLRHDRGALVRAVLEGVAYALRDSLELLGSLGVETDRARVSGGGARGDLWLRIVASVLGIPLEVPSVGEGAAFGAALLGGVAGGVFESGGEAVESCVSVSRTIEPDDGWRAPYDEGYATFRTTYPALRAVARPARLPSETD